MGNELNEFVGGVGVGLEVESGECDVFLLLFDFEEESEEFHVI